MERAMFAHRNWSYESIKKPQHRHLAVSRFCCERDRVGLPEILHGQIPCLDIEVPVPRKQPRQASKNWPNEYKSSSYLSVCHGVYPRVEIR